jgi:hypothetical protein
LPLIRITLLGLALAALNSCSGGSGPRHGGGGGRAVGRGSPSQGLHQVSQYGGDGGYNGLWGWALLALAGAAVLGALVVVADRAIARRTARTAKPGFAIVLTAAVLSLAACGDTTTPTPSPTTKRETLVPDMPVDWDQPAAPVVAAAKPTPRTAP